MRAKKLLTSRQILRYAVPARTVTKKALCLRQDNGEKRMQAQVPLYPYPCNILN